MIGVVFLIFEHVYHRTQVVPDVKFSCGLDTCEENIGPGLREEMPRCKNSHYYFLIENGGRQGGDQPLKEGEGREEGGEGREEGGEEGGRGEAKIQLFEVRYGGPMYLSSDQISMLKYLNPSSGTSTLGPRIKISEGP